MRSFVEKLGNKTIMSILYFGSLSVLTFDSFRHIVASRKRGNLLKHIDSIGIDSFPLVGIISAFIGMILVMETAYTLKKFGAEIYAGGIVSISMIRELGPVFVAFVLAGRVGASIAAEIGSMKITEQVDALKMLAVDPVAYLVTPRVLAGIISLPSLFIISFFLSILGGFIVGVFIVGIPSGMFLYQCFRFITFKDLFVGLSKSVVFAVVVINASSYEGLRAQGGAVGVGRAATNSVVVSFFLIILANLLLTSIFYFI
ncbi:MAG TPA: ABC transporter permease [bacterium]|nr:ABC transporter permease [bacterium]